MIIFVEPNPFASRLHVLAPLTTGAVRTGQRVAVAMPTRPDGQDFEQFSLDVSRDAEIIIRSRYERESQMFPIHWSTIKDLLQWARVQFALADNRTLVLTAVDDYPLLLWLVALFIRVRMPATRTFIIRYRVADLLPLRAGKLRQRLKRTYFAACARIVHGKVAHFDERVPVGDKVVCIPDPWSGPFGILTRAEARRKLGWQSNVPTIALIGRQDRRKGFDVAVPALLRIKADLPSLRVALVGKVSDSMAGQFARLQSVFKGDLEHVNEYISDERLALIFSGSSVVLLPYHRDFTSTSGVLTRAAASGTPVVAARHGLVGWRTLKYGLGATFPPGDSKELASAIRRILSAPHDGLQGRSFAAASTAEELARTFARLLDE